MPNAAKMQPGGFASTGWNAYVEQTAAGDHDALTQLYDESCRLVYGLLVRILGNAADADEVCVDVYLQVWRTAHTFDTRRGSALAWLVTVARSRALDRLRASASRKAQELNGADSTAGVALGRLPDELACSEQEAARVSQATEALNEKEKQVIELAYFKGMSHSEIAAQLHEPLGTIKTRIRGALAKLRKGLAVRESGDAA